MCNRKFGKLETDLLARLIGCVDPKSEAASGLHSRVLRSLGIEAGELSEKETAIRNGRRDRIRAEFIPVTEVAELPGRIPGLGPSLDKAARFVTPIPMDGLSMVAEKIARGCEYNHKKRKRYVEPPYGIRTSICETGIVPEPFASASHIIDFGPGCKVTRVFVTEDPNIVLYWITIWGTLHMHVRIDLQAELQKVPVSKFEGLPMGPEKAGMKVPDYLRRFDETTKGSIQ